MAVLDTLEASYPHLALIGNYRGGVGVEKCYHNAHATAERLAGVVGDRVTNKY